MSLRVAGEHSRCSDWRTRRVIDKFSTLSMEEIEAMLNLDSLKTSRVYQEAKEEGVLENKLETIPKLIKLGLNTEEIAEFLELNIETVRKNTQQ
ncbi:hypothetical protein [Rivularia sp. UHCC 0363]|uniref:hypothetical protein n=1 Tax=Rivularia sp. UHCC 0363 TaxID=3110244 RepID=UPI002B21F9FC|nr:hypothetical protein [Rivularia sp. UHCC 0363]MEA5599345.1 hypothetical protein [Rivularia sp. UHCC 0363]